MPSTRGAALERVDGPASACVVWDDTLLAYDFGPSHPMSPARLDLTMRLIDAMALTQWPGVCQATAPVAPVEILRLGHEADYIAAVGAASRDRICDPSRGLGTVDDPVFPGMHEAAARIVGGSVEAADALSSGTVSHAVNIAGGMHHAMPGSASGFCVYNDAVIAIHRLLDCGARTVAYLDFDAHHGDGVERAFWNDSRVLTVSVHQDGRTLFPGTGASETVGGPGAPGYAVNVPVPPRTDGASWLRAIDAVIPPLLDVFGPEVIVSQHGCDTHARDPLSDLRVGLAAQRTAARWVHHWAHGLAGGRWLALGGGGYAVAQVVPMAWACLVGEAVHAPPAPGDLVPQAWRDYVAEQWGVLPPRVFEPWERDVRSWTADDDQGEGVDPGIWATRRAVFPLWGLDPETR